MTWLRLSITAAVLGGIASFLIFLLGRQAEHKPRPLAINLAYYASMAAVGAMIMVVNPQYEILKNYRSDVGRILTNDNNMGAYAFITALAFIIGNLTLFTSYHQSPNPGLCDGIAAFSGVLVFLYGVVLFGKKYTLTHVLGLILIIASVFLIGS